VRTAHRDLAVALADPQRRRQLHFALIAVHVLARVDARDRLAVHVLHRVVQARERGVDQLGALDRQVAAGDEQARRESRTRRTFAR